MRIAVVGVGCIGSVVAAHFARAMHDVALVARGERYLALQQDGLNVRPHGSKRSQTFRLPVFREIGAVPEVDVLVVATQMQQVEAILPALVAHPAKRVCLLMNVHPVPDAWKLQLGERLILGFPAMLAGYRDHEVAYRTLPSWLRFVMITTFGAAKGTDGSAARALADTFVQVGLAATYDDDMESWLASHAALVTGLMGFASRQLRAGKSLTMSWSDAFAIGRALHEALALVRASGARLVPVNVAALRYTPVAGIASVMWTLSRLPWFTGAVADYASHSRSEVHAMHAGLRERAALGSPNLDALCV